MSPLEDDGMLRDSCCRFGFVLDADPAGLDAGGTGEAVGGPVFDPEVTSGDLKTDESWKSLRGR